MPNLEIENQYLGKIIAGVDEVGRGPLAGPVVACAVILDLNNIPLGINDSKKLSIKKRELISLELKEKAIWAIGVIEPEEIDQINILQATKFAMVKAIDQLPNYPDIALIDGNQPPILKCETISVIKGDSKSLSIAAASIIAKVTRDKIMHDLSKIYSFYNWSKNSGYGTAEHLKALTDHGITPVHRKSFAPIKHML